MSARATCRLVENGQNQPLFAHETLDRPLILLQLRFFFFFFSLSPAAMASSACDAEEAGYVGLIKEMRPLQGRTARRISSMSLRKKSALSLPSRVRQISYYTGPTVGGLLNATCGNATELIIALFALQKGNIDLVKFSLVGSVLSNLLLVLGTSLFCGGVANLGQEQLYDRKQTDANTCLLLLGALCHMLPLMFQFAVNYGEHDVLTIPTLALSRVCSIVMLTAYIAFIFFQLKTHWQLFEAREENNDGDDSTEFEDKAVIGFASAFVWLLGATIIIAVLSEFIVGTIEDASESWGLSVSFISIIVLPIVGNAAEHAGAVIFAVKNKLDITLGVSLGSATQISMFVVPFSVIVAWIMGVQMDLDFKILETGSLVLSIVITAFALQDGTSHYLKGLILLQAYIVIGACFFVLRTPDDARKKN